MSDCCCSTDDYWADDYSPNTYSSYSVDFGPTEFDYQSYATPSYAEVTYDGYQSYAAPSYAVFQAEVTYDGYEYAEADSNDYPYDSTSYAAPAYSADNGGSFSAVGEAASGGEEYSDNSSVSSATGSDASYSTGTEFVGAGGGDWGGSVPYAVAPAPPAYASYSGYEMMTPGGSYDLAPNEFSGFIAGFPDGWTPQSTSGRQVSAIPTGEGLYPGVGHIGTNPDY